MKSTRYNFFEAAEKFDYMTDDSVKFNFSQNLRLLRERIGVTQEEFAHRIGVSRQAVSLYEKGDRIPDICIFSRIIEVTGCSPYFLLNSQESMVDKFYSLSEETGLSDEACHKLYSHGGRLTEAMELLLSSESFWHFVDYVNFAYAGRTINPRVSTFKSDKKLSRAYFCFKAHCLIDDIIETAENIARERYKKFGEGQLENEGGFPVVSDEDESYYDIYSHLQLEFDSDEALFDIHGELEERLNATSSELKQAREESDREFESGVDELEKLRLKEIAEDKFERFKAKLLKYGPYSERKTRNAKND